jgi:hypothetical protein
MIPMLVAMLAIACEEEGEGGTPTASPAATEEASPAAIKTSQTTSTPPAALTPEPTPTGIEASNCDLYERPMAKKENEECTCPAGYEKFLSYNGAYCATNSGQPCSASTDCPKGEECISDDGRKWFCTGQWAGCFYHNPENPEEICAD